MYGWSFLPRTRRWVRLGARRHPFVRAYLEELESRTVFDASTGVITTTAFPVLGPAFVSNINNTAVLQGPGSPATALQTVGGLPTNALVPGTLAAGTVSAPALLVAATNQAGVPGTAAPNPLSPLNPVQLEQATAPPATPPVAIAAWSPILSRLNPVETQMASSAFPIADFVGNSAPLPLLSSLARANSAAGNGGVAVPATGRTGGSGPALPVRPAAGDMDGAEDELLDALRGLTRLDDDLSGADRPAADGQQAGAGDSQAQTVVQNTLFADGDWMVHRPDDRIPSEVVLSTAP